MLLTRSDSGRTVLNISYLAGGLLSTSLSNAYYPFHERGFGDTMVRWGGGVGSDAGLLILHEFWPEIKAKLGRNKLIRRMEDSKVGQKVEKSMDGMSPKPANKPTDATNPAN